MDSLLDDIKKMAESLGESPNDSFLKAGIDEAEWSELVYLNCPKLVTSVALLGLHTEMSSFIQFILCSGALIQARLQAEANKAKTSSLIQ